MCRVSSGPEAEGEVALGAQEFRRFLDTVENNVGKMSGAILILVGGGLVIAGLAIAGSGRKETIRVGNTGFSLFGPVTQTFRSVGMAITGERQRTARDWIGWGLSACGLIVGLVGLVSS